MLHTLGRQSELQSILFNDRNPYKFRIREKQGAKGMKQALRMMVQACLLGCLVIGTLSYGQDTSTEQAAPDNTKINQRDKNKAEPTADQQKENRPDREITRQIRRSIVQDKNLSTYAHNVKIISQNGMVTLKGPVRSDEEKAAVEAKAAEVAGKDKVTSQLEVKPKQ
jgi:hyperosmotically inducible periplasmic protein